MALIWKEIGPPGNYHTPDGVVVITPRRLRHWQRQNKAMKAKGLPVPLPWEHQDDAVPRTAAERMAHGALFNAGFVEDMEFRGRSLWALCDIPNEVDARQAIEAVRFVSPEIKKEWTDGDGQVWNDVITHLALTPRPINYRQKPFDPADRLSHGTIRLSMAQLRGESHMAEEKDDFEDTESETETEPEVEEGPSSDEEYLEEAKKLLSAMDIHLPDHTDMKSFMRDLCVALHAVSNRTDSDEGAYGGVREETPTSMAMSHSREIKALREQNSELLAQRQLDRLDVYERERRVSPARARELRDLIGTKRLSFATGDKDVAAISVELDVIGRTPKGTFGVGKTRTRLSHGSTSTRTEERSPRTPWGQESGEVVDAARGREVAAEQLKNSGITPNFN